MDDVALIHEDKTILQRMMDITNDIAMRYHIEFGTAKCKIVKIGKGPTAEIKLNNQTLEEVKQYKYLGEIINNKGNITDHINEIERKVNAATQNILIETGNKEFKGIKMRAIWQLIESVIIPIITYGAEGWNPNRGELEKIEKIFNKALKTVIGAPTSTPTTILLVETGFLLIELVINKKIIMQALRVGNKVESKLIRKVTKGEDSIWKKRADELIQKYNLEEDIENESKNIIKQLVKEENEEKFLGTIESEANNKTKVAHWKEMKQSIKPGERPRYMEKLTRKQCRIILKTRSRMIPVKENMTNNQDNQQCRLCGEEQETQRHIIEECQKIKEKLEINRTKTIKYEEIFKDDDIDNLEKIANQLIEIEKELENRKN